MRPRNIFLFLSFVGIIVAGAASVLFYANLARALVYGGGPGDSTSVSSPTATSLYVSWSTSYAGVTSQTVYRNVNGGGYSYIGSVGSGSGYGDSGLSCGNTYGYYVCSNYGCTSSGSGATTACAPAAPTGFSATPVSQSQINLAWTASSGANGYYIYRNGSYIGATSATSYSDVGLSCNGGGTYYAVAYNGGGNSGGSNTSAASTDQCTPGTPTIGTATCTSQTTATVTWTRNTPYTESGFEIHSGGGPLRGTAAAASTSGTASGLSAGTPYNFYVNAYVNTNGRTYYSANSANSNICTTIPPTPTGFAGTAASPIQINLSWTAASGATSYTLARTGGGTIYSGGSTSYSDTGLSPSTSYSYSLTASNAAGTSGAASVTVSTAADTTPPNISFSPAQTSYTSPDNNPTPWGSGNVSVTVTASDAYSGISSTLYCWTTGASCTPVTSFTNGTALSQTVEGAWKLCVKATDTSSNTVTSCQSPYDIDKTAPGSTDTWSSVSTNGFVIFAGGDQAYPALPVNAQTTGAVLSPEHVSWCSYRSGTACDPTLANPCVNNTSGTCAYGAGPANPTYFGNVFTCYDNSTCSGPTYVKYRGYDDAANYEATVHSFIFNYDRTPPTTPTVTPTVNNCHSITWSLSGSSDTGGSGLAAAPYAMNTTSTETWSITDPTGKWMGASAWTGWQSSNAFVETGLAENTSYTRYFMARDALGNETPVVSASAVTVNCPPAAPTGLSATAVSQTQVNLSWLDNATNEAAYYVFRGGVNIAPLAANTTSYSDTGLSCGTGYSYYVSASNNGGSTNSAAASATTNSCVVAPSSAPPSTTTPDSGVPSATATTQTVTSTGYYVVRCNSDGVTGCLLVANNTTGGSVPLSGLTCPKSYKVFYYAYNTDPTVGALDSSCNDLHSRLPSLDLSQKKCSPPTSENLDIQYCTKGFLLD